MRRILQTFGVGSMLVGLIAGCSSYDGLTGDLQPTNSPYSSSRGEDQKEALLNYVDAERMTIPQMLAAAPDIYSEIAVEATFEDIRNSRYLPDGVHAVVWFDYTYVPGYDLASAYRQIEASEPDIQSLCESAIFPLMREYGVEPPFGATFTYHPAQETMAPLNTLSCSSTR